MLFVCHPNTISKPEITLEVFGKAGYIALLDLKIDDAQRIATEILVEVQRRKGGFQ